MHINSMYGNITSSSFNVRYQTSGRVAVLMTTRHISMTTAMIKERRTVKSVKMVDANFHADFLSFSYASENRGMKAADRAPSPNNRLNKFGILNANTKAEPSADVPNRCAMRILRSRPNSLLVPVHMPTIRLDFINIFVFILFAFFALVLGNAVFTLFFCLVVFDQTDSKNRTNQATLSPKKASSSGFLEYSILDVVRSMLDVLKF